MDPDVVLTIAFVVYAVVAAIGVGFLITHNHRDSGMDDDAAHLGDTRVSSEAYRLSGRALDAPWSDPQAEMGSPPDGGLVVRPEP
jgi:hypothetical protein